MSVLLKANERLDQHYELKSNGIDVDRAVKRVEEVLGAEYGSVFD